MKIVLFLYIFGVISALFTRSHNSVLTPVSGARIGNLKILQELQHALNFSNDFQRIQALSKTENGRFAAKNAIHEIVKRKTKTRGFRNFIRFHKLRK